MKHFVLPLIIGLSASSAVLAHNDDEEKGSGKHGMAQMMNQHMGDNHGGNMHDNAMHNHKDDDHGHGPHMLAGEPGHADDVDKTVRIDASDAMRFEHEPFSVKAGETVKFVVHNSGKMPHEFVIGTQSENRDHRIEMMKVMAGKMMEHKDSNAISLKPGETKEMIWRFSHRSDIEAGCNLPGHYEGGMHTAIDVK